MTSGFKKPGILRASFHYQDLAAIGLLIDFYRAPDVYQWAEFDSDNPDFAAIEDVVLCRRDGRLEFTQVKFTVDPGDPANLLSWDWLLQRKGAGRSLLQKWAATVAQHARAGTLASAELFTGRRPAPDFAAALSGRHIDPAKIQKPIADQIEGQIGAADMALLFAHFRFRHSQPEILELEYDLQARLVPSDIDDAGWATLGNAVKEWATLKNRPAPDGRVRHHHIRAVISRDRPRPIRQDFEVPHGYRPPDVESTAPFARM